MAVTKKIRFEVFKRDGFVCQYCGKYPPDVALEIDHIKPKSRKGKDDINNLITSCFDCNRGKSNVELKRIPNTLQENQKILEEKELQYKEYQKMLAKVNKRINKDIEKVDLIYNGYYEDYILSEGFKKATVKMFIKNLGLHPVIDAMEKACAIFENHSNGSEISIKYFCGICWSEIKNKEVNHG